MGIDKFRHGISEVLFMALLSYYNGNRKSKEGCEMNSSTALAHISEDGLRVQTVAEHLQGTAKLCGHFANVYSNRSLSV